MTARAEKWQRSDEAHAEEEMFFSNNAEVTEKKKKTVWGFNILLALTVMVAALET